MKITPEKLAVLECLKRHQTPLSLSELMTQLKGDYSARSVRRWLAQMAAEKIIIKTGEKRSTRYITPNENVFTIQKKPLIFNSENAAIINQVQQPLFKRKPITYSSEWLESYEPNITQYLSSELQEQLLQAGNRAKDHEPAGTYAHHIYNRLLIDLSYNSSRLEGNTYSLLDTKRLLIDGIRAPDKLDEEKIMILNHKDAIRYIVDNADKLQITDIEICTLHFLLGDSLIPTHYAGKVRNHGVRISGSTYIPLENPTQLTQQLNQICQKAALIDAPYERSFFLLTHISYLQAFTDVNKRTARLSANIPLIQNNLVPLSFNDITREDYASAMIAIYELNNINPLLELYLFSYLRTCNLYDSTVEAAGFDEVRVRYRHQRKAIIRSIIMGKLTGQKMDHYIQTQATLYIEESFRNAFIEDVREDLMLISPARIAGLGISIQQLEEWLKRRDTK